MRKRNLGILNYKIKGIPHILHFKERHFLWQIKTNCVHRSQKMSLLKTRENTSISKSKVSPEKFCPKLSKKFCVAASQLSLQICTRISHEFLLKKNRQITELLSTY